MFGGYFCFGWVRAAAAEARSQVAASQMMIKDRKVFILFIHLFIIYSLFFLVFRLFDWGCNVNPFANSFHVGIGFGSNLPIGSAT